jgi:hypothetical protein
MTSGVVIVVAQLGERFRVQIREWLGVRRPAAVGGVREGAGNMGAAIRIATPANDLLESHESASTEPAVASPAGVLAGHTRSLSAPGSLGIDR